MTRREMVVCADFDPSVLNSRPSSCVRNSRVRGVQNAAAAEQVRGGRDAAAAEQMRGGRVAAAAEQVRTGRDATAADQALANQFAAEPPHADDVVGKFGQIEPRQHGQNHECPHEQLLKSESH